MDGNTHSAQKALAAEAADWHTRLRAQNLSDIDAARFRGWLAAHPERRREFEAVETFWEGFGVLEHSPEVIRARAEMNARRRSAKRARFQKIAGLSAAAAVVLACASLLFIQNASNTRLATAIGEQRTVPLADGSIITLNTNSEVRIDYTEARRGVELVRGQANFEVAKDASRPFIVRAGRSEVRAVGTVFDVYKAADTVTVTLIEGKVAVKDAQAEVMLSPGEQLSYGNREISKKPSHIDVPRVTAWRARKLDFLNTPLAEAVQEANRYSRDEIVLQAPSLHGARISGTFEAGKTELFVEGVRSLYRLNVQRVGEHRIVLSDAQSAAR